MNFSRDVGEYDPVRDRIVKLALHRGLTLKELSLKIGRNHAYLQQFVRRGSPRTLPEPIRLELAQILGVPESDLNGAKAPDDPTTMAGKQHLSDIGLTTFAMRLAAVRLNSVYTTPGIFADVLNIDIGRYNELENGSNDPSLQELNAISKASRVSLDWLIRGTSDIEFDETIDNPMADRSGVTLKP